MGDQSPWQGKTPTECGHDEPHDPDRCATCTPVTRTSAHARGVARANEVQTHLPLSSAAPDTRAGRDGYET